MTQRLGALLKLCHTEGMNAHPPSDVAVAQPPNTTVSPKPLWGVLIWLPMVGFYVFGLVQSWGKVPMWLWGINLLGGVYYVWITLVVTFSWHEWLMKHAGLVTLLVGAFMVPLNPGANVHFIFALCVMAATWPMRQMLFGIAATMLLAVCLTYVFDVTLGFLLPVVLIGPLVVMSIWLNRNEVRLSRSEEEIEEWARMGERARISRDLHDLLGHSLTGMVTSAQLVRRLIETGHHDEALAEVSRMETQGRQALQQVRGSVLDIRQASLAAECARQKAMFSRRAITFTHPEVPLSLPSNVDVTLSLVLRELCTNVLRHSDAMTVTLNWHEHSDHWLMQFHDCGSKPIVREGMGLGGIRERLAAVQGTMERYFDRGNGVIIRVSKADD